MKKVHILTSGQRYLDICCFVLCTWEATFCKAERNKVRESDRDGDETELSAMSCKMLSVQVERNRALVVTRQIQYR